jgi:hypothetical protein
MQASVLEFLLVEPMTVTDKAFRDLSQKVTSVAERVAKLEGAAVPKNTWTAWLPIGAPAVALIALMAAVGIHLDSKIGDVQKDIRSINTRLGKQEDAIKALTDQQSEATQKLIHDLLSAATKTTDPTIAARALGVASSLTATLREKKQTASAEFFRSAIDIVRQSKQPTVQTAVFEAQRQLAEYRSTLQPIPQQSHGGFECAPGSNMRSVFGPSGNQVTANRLISGTTIKNCPQTLDGFTWVNVVFINSTISYKGGPVVLANVSFINCTFVAPQTDDGVRMLQYAALDEKSFKVNPEFFNPAPPS